MDWLHPSHGPFPDLCADWEDTKTEIPYRVAIWDIQTGWICSVVSPEMHDGYMQTFCWKPFGKTGQAICVTGGDATVAKLQEGKQLEQLSMASIRLIGL